MKFSLGHWSRTFHSKERMLIVQVLPSWWAFGVRRYMMREGGRVIGQATRVCFGPVYVLSVPRAKVVAKGRRR